MTRINLLPAKVRKTKGAQRVVTYFVLGGSALALVLMVLLLNLLALTHRAEVAARRAEAATAQLSETVRVVKALQAQEQYADRLRGLIRGLQPGQAVWISILDELAGLIREDLWLSRLNSVPAPGGAGLRLETEGEAYSKISVADFLSALENSPRFTEVQLEALTDTRTAAGLQVKFKIMFSCRPSQGGNAHAHE
jgi:Tfp pilus assembly protein PilN